MLKDYSHIILENLDDGHKVAFHKLYHNEWLEVIDGQLSMFIVTDEMVLDTLDVWRTPSDDDSIIIKCLR